MVENAIVGVSMLIIGAGFSGALMRKRMIDVALGINVAAFGLVVLSLYFHTGPTSGAEANLVTLVLMLISLLWFVMGLISSYRQFMNRASSNVDDANNMRH